MQIATVGMVAERMVVHSIRIVKMIVNMGMSYPVFMQTIMIVIVSAMTVAVRVGVAVHRAIRMDVFVGVWMTVIMRMIMVMTFDLCFTLAAAANGTHSSSFPYSTSRSLTRISVPPVACTW
jgi:hypothetical protein